MSTLETLEEYHDTHQSMLHYSSALAKPRDARVRLTHDLPDAVEIVRFEDLPLAGSRPCANCARLATVFCRADAALLCAPCDVEVHSANRLAGRHNRVPLPFPSSPFVSFSAPSSPLDELLLQAGAHVAREAAQLALSSGTLLHAASCKAEVILDAEGTERKRRARQEALVRFRMKRSRRSFVKTVRYECRKTLAENRPRVKGRFVNKSDMGLFEKYGEQYRCFLQEVGETGGGQSSEGSAILSDAANSPESQGDGRYGFY